jgi:conjugative transfer region protein (TIGR03748 family)
MLKKFLISISLILLFGQPALAEDITAIDQYMTVANKPKPEQIDLLSQTLQVRFPQNIQTVGDAIFSLLKISGYSLIDSKHQSDALKITLSKPLPLVDKEFDSVHFK